MRRHGSRLLGVLGGSLVFVSLAVAQDWSSSFGPEGYDAMLRTRHRPNQVKLPPQWEVTSVEQLLPGARHMLRYAGVKEGEKVLFLTEQWMDPLWLEAFFRAGLEMGAIVDAIQLSPVAHRPGGSMLFGRGKTNIPWYPEFVVQAVEEADVMWATISVEKNLPQDQIEWGEKQKEQRRLPLTMPRTAEGLAFTPWSTFPVELHLAIERRFFEILDLWNGKAKKVRITDPLGTDLTATLDLDKEWMHKNFPNFTARMHEWLMGHAEYLWSHVYFSVVSSKVADGQGVVVANATHWGPIPTIWLKVEGGRVTAVEGGGDYGEFWNKMVRQWEGEDYGNPHGKGVRWWHGVAFGTNPKVVRGDFFKPTYFKEQKSYWGEWDLAFRRSGIIHMSFGSSDGGNYFRPDGKVGFKMNVDLYFPTVTVDGKKIVDHGRFTVLDDPEVRRIAAKYGDPDELLKEEWLKPGDPKALEEYLNGWPNSKF